MAVVEELQRMQARDRHVVELLEQALGLLDAHPVEGGVPPRDQRP